MAGGWLPDGGLGMEADGCEEKTESEGERLHGGLG